MSASNKVLWTEGMFLLPQQFQQHDRYLENFVNGRCLGLQAFGWGFSNLTINSDLLKIGKIALTQCQGIFPDGTPFNLPDDDALPLPLDIPKESQNEIVFLSLPIRRPQGIETDDVTTPDSLARYRRGERDIRDNHSDTDRTASIQIGTLKTRILMEKEERSGYSCLGVARIAEMRADGNAILDRRFIPPCLDCQGAPILGGFLRELHGLLNTRGEALGGRVSHAGHGGVAEIADFLLLQLVNRYQPLLEHFSRMAGLHPEHFFRYGLQLAGELSTFFAADKRPVRLPDYIQDDLQATFTPLMEELRQLLGKVHEPSALQLPLSKPQFGVYAAKLPDTTLLDDAMFVLAANAEVAPEKLRKQFPSQVTIAPVETIQKYVTSLTSGIPIHPLPVAPRQIPFHAGFTYFELNKHTELWREMINSAGFAIHIGGNYPRLELEFWAVRKV